MRYACCASAWKCIQSKEKAASIYPRNTKYKSRCKLLKRFTFCAVPVKEGEAERTRLFKMLGIATAQNAMSDLEANMEKMRELKLKQKGVSPRSSPELDDSGLTVEVY